MKIAIILPSKYLAPQYSLVSVVENQLRMLIQHGYQPILLLKEDCKKSYKNLKGVEYRRCLPSFEGFPYKNVSLRREDKPWLRKSVSELYANLKDADLVITHDIIYLEQFLVYNLAIRQVAERLPHLYWLHWIHSPVYGKNPIWKKMKRSRVVIPNHEHRRRVAKTFGYPLTRVKTVYHPINPFPYPLHPLTKKLIELLNLHNADIVQLYPADARRLDNKQINIVIEIFSRLKKRGKKVRLIIANQRCVNDACRENVEMWMRYALEQGLTKKEILFTSQFQAPRWEGGISHEVILELFQYATNLFILPSFNESFSLVALEAAAGGNLLVLNEGLSFLKKLIGEKNSLFYKFGKLNSQGKLYGMRSLEQDRYLSYVADRIIKKIDQEMCLRAKRRVRQRFNSEWIFKNQFEPLLRGLKNAG